MPKHLKALGEYPSKLTVEQRDRVRLTGVEPLDVMITKMRWHFKRFENTLDADEKSALEYLDRAHDAAVDAAPYVHGKFATINHKSTDGSVDLSRLTDAQLAAFMIDVTPNDENTDDKRRPAIAGTGARSIKTPRGTIIPV